MNKEKFVEALVSTGKALQRSLPILLGVFILISLSNFLIPKEAFLWIFKTNFYLDPLIGSFFGSILAGNPLTSYILGGELLQNGISLIAVTAFIVAWVTVGVIQLPAEIVLLGKKYALVRNITAFFMAIIVALITVAVMSI